MNLIYGASKDQQSTDFEENDDDDDDEERGVLDTNRYDVAP